MTRPRLSSCDARLLEAEPFGVGHAADRDEHDSRPRSSPPRRPPTGSIVTRRRRRLRLVDARDLVPSLKLDALLGQHALELLGDLAVHAGQDAVEELDDRHLGAEPPPHRAELQPDDAGADDQQLLRHLVQRQRAGRGDDALLVDARRPAAAPTPSRWR